ncbi:hypothetical protein ACFP2T_18160 [Plantactinospora solaniradicis]|uniref:Glycosyltransferase RgtA/B/C/D-like domain-containing protein n=1 Tax=Plantactinospora solaniradicis TaxID=1723736 RepID=A0ABW1K9D2_9ACTN
MSDAEAAGTGRSTKVARPERPARPIRVSSRIRPRLSTLLWLAAAVALGTFVAVDAPRTGLDPSWTTAINIAAAEDRRFGQDLLFTFGPWGFLDHPLLVDAHQFALGLLFGAAVTTALFCAAYVCLRYTWSPAVAGPLAFAVTLARPVTEPGLGVVCAGLLLALRTVQRRSVTGGCGWRGTWPTALLAASGALMVQVKFSEGLAILVLAGIVALSPPTPRALALNLGAALATLPATFVAGWLLAGQPPDAVPTWLHGTWQIASGYPEAMAIGGFHELRSYLLAGVLVAVAGWLTVRMARACTGALALAPLLLVTAGLAFGFKHGFIRHDAYHEPSFFMVAAFALVALARYARRPAAVLAVVALTVAAVPRELHQFNPAAAIDRWRTSAAVLLDDDQRVRLLEQGAQRARAEYRLPADMVTASEGRPVSVDPWEATLPWAYAMDWNPVPVFQAYAAYTPYLDELNARALASAPPDQIVLKEDRAPIDDRNSRWETPHYLLVLACEYTRDAQAGRWSLLRHGRNRCGEARTVDAREVHAGEIVDSPAVGAEEILLARFTPRPDGPLRSLGTALLKDRSPFLVTADGRRYRLPERLADGPLMVSFPDTPARTDPLDPFRYQRLSFSKPGNLEFQVVTVG